MRAVLGFMRGALYFQGDFVVSRNETNFYENWKNNFRQIVRDLQPGVGVTFLSLLGALGGCFMVSWLIFTYLF